MSTITLAEARGLLRLRALALREGDGVRADRANELLCQFINQYYNRTAVIEWLMEHWSAENNFTNAK